jgi:hypothetical protein
VSPQGKDAVFANWMLLNKRLLHSLRIIVGVSEKMAAGSLLVALFQGNEKALWAAGLFLVLSLFLDLLTD